MIKKEIKIFFTALMFYTRIPVPKSTGYSPENLNKATRYFPLVGIIVGGAGAGIFFLANLLFSVEVSLLISISSMVLLTGAFHEDAFADFCDGFGGGYTKEKILTIMKDSRIGTFGSVGLVLLLAAKFFLLAEFEGSLIPLVLITAHAYSRVNPVLLIFSSPYVRDTDDSKAKPVGNKASPATLIIALICGLLPQPLLPLVYLPITAGIQILILLFFRRYVLKKIGGYTGDVLGALQQISEIGFYCTCLVLFRFL